MKFRDSGVDVLNNYRRLLNRRRCRSYSIVGTADVSVPSHRCCALTVPEKIRYEEIAMGVAVPEPAVLMAVANLAESRSCIKNRELFSKKKEKARTSSDHTVKKLVWKFKNGSVILHKLVLHFRHTCVAGLQNKMFTIK